jgi:HK97 family phage major capsid protein
MCSIVTQGRYLWSSPDGSVGTSRMWDLPVVASPSLAAKTFIVAAFSQSTILFDRTVLMLEVSYENEDDFINNLACFRAELRFALGVPVPGGVLKGTLP